MISKGIFKRPNMPTTEDATKIFGINPISIILNDLKIIKSMKAITLNTTSRDPICD
jgi:hypothetical protein